MTITNQEIAVLRKMFAKTKAKTDPLVLAQRNPGAPPYAKNMIAAQNVLKDCITTIVNECMPIEDDFCGELAVRLASYAISIVPVERQQELSEIVAKSLPAAHLARMKAGVGISAQWVTDGVEHPNMPEKGRTN